MSKRSEQKLHRAVVDKIISWTGIVVAVALLFISSGLFWAQSFVHDQVAGQLSMQNIVFPEEGSEELLSLPKSSQDSMSKYAGQKMTTGAQAKVYADDYIAVHVKAIGQGKTYAELSSESMKNPDNAKLKGQVDTVFRGEVLRGMLLNAYAFGTMGLIALYAAWISLALGALMLILALLGFNHAKQINR